MLRKAIILLFALVGASALAQNELSTPEGEEPPPEPNAKLLSRGFDFGGMMVTPSKLTMSADSIGAFYVINRSSNERDFRVVIVALDSADSEYSDSGELLRFGPRQFSLSPDGSQLIRLTVRRSDNAVNSPQRARIKVSLLPEVAPQSDPSNGGESEAFTLSFEGIYSISVPIDIAP